MTKVLWEFKEQQCQKASLKNEVVQEVGLERGADEDKAEGHSVRRKLLVQKHGETWYLGELARNLWMGQMKCEVIKVCCQILEGIIAIINRPSCITVYAS